MEKTALVLGATVFGLIGLFIVGSLGAGIVGSFIPWAAVQYSDGERTGLVNKISHKGLICQTWEGQMLVGNGNNVDPEEYFFTVKDDAVVKQVQDAQGKIATLHYKQYALSSNCWGDTSYEVVGVTVK